MSRSHSEPGAFNAGGEPVWRLHKKDDTRSMFRIVAVSCLLFAMASAVLAIPFFWKQYEVLREWQPMQAKVRSSDVVEVTVDGAKQYATRFEFEIPSPGSGLRTVVVNGYREGVSYGTVRAAAARFPVGAAVVVRVNPRNPHDLRLDSDQPRRYFLLPLSLGITALVFAGLSFALFLVGQRFD